MTTRNRELTSYEAALVSWLESCVSVPVIVEDSDGPRPRSGYVTVKVIAYFDRGTAQKRVLDETYQGKCRGEVSQESTGTASVQTFGKGARELLDVLKMSYSIPPTKELLNSLGLSIRSATDSLDLSGLEGTRTVPRFSSDFTFGYALAVDYAADVIETLDAQEI